MGMNPLELNHHLSNLILAIPHPSPLLVGVDGIDAAGKTTLADELANILRSSPRQIIRASIDGFHLPKEVRYRRGKDSPIGYYLDSFDYPAVLRNLIAPLLPGGSREYRTHIFDYVSNVSSMEEPHIAKEDSILVMDGIFLFRPVLVSYWNFKIFVDVDFEKSLERGVRRDVGYIPTLEEAVKRYQTRYIPAQRLYLKEAYPKKIANVVIKNDDVYNPIITKCKNCSHY